jgi:hypothetical protein
MFAVPVDLCRVETIELDYDGSDRVHDRLIRRALGEQQGVDGGEVRNVDGRAQITNYAHGAGWVGCRCGSR